MSTSLHVLGVARTLPFHSIGGMQAIAWDIFRLLAMQGYQVTVLTTSIPGRSMPFEEDGVRVVPLPAAPPERYSRAWWAASDAAALRVHAEQPVHAVLSVSSAAAGLKKFRTAVPDARFVFQAHGTSWGEFSSKMRSGNLLQYVKAIKNLYWMARDFFAYRLFHRIVVVGDTLLSEFGQWPMPLLTGGVPTQLIRNGIDDGVFAPRAEHGAAVRSELGIPAEDKLVLFVARLHPQKGGLQMLRTFEHLSTSRPDVSLLFVGSGEQEAELRRAAASGSAARRIHFTGGVSREQIPRYLSAGDAFAFPTKRREVGLPLNVLEALASGLPVVLSNVLDPGGKAIEGLTFADPDDTTTFAAMVSKALDSAASFPSRRSLLPAEYSLKFCVQEYDRLLDPTRGGLCAS